MRLTRRSEERIARVLFSTHEAFPTGNVVKLRKDLIENTTVRDEISVEKATNKIHPVGMKYRSLASRLPNETSNQRLIILPP